MRPNKSVPQTDITCYFIVTSMDHLFNKYAKFFAKLTTNVCVSGDKKCYFFGKFCVHTKWMIPYSNVGQKRNREINRVTKTFCNTAQLGDKRWLINTWFCVMLEDPKTAWKNKQKINSLYSICRVASHNWIAFIDLKNCFIKNFSKKLK